jgi:hypothetical protein
MWLREKETSMAVGRRNYLPFLALFVALTPIAMTAQAPAAGSAEPQLTISQVVDNLVQKNAERAKALKGYRGKRIYHLEYAGFPTTLRAEMIVEMTYNAPASKEFTILSESGSKWIVKHVLKRLIEAEAEAQQTSTRASVELNTQNYEFTSLEQGPDADGCTYVLGIRPKASNKFLYRGRIWLDDRDFAVCRIEAEPGKNPSIWITKTDIRHKYEKIQGFWLPVENQSVSVLRVGGRATLTITYQHYEINPSGPVKHESAYPSR